MNETNIKGYARGYQVAFDKVDTEDGLKKLVKGAIKELNKKLGDHVLDALHSMFLEKTINRYGYKKVMCNKY